MAELLRAGDSVQSGVSFVESVWSVFSGQLTADSIYMNLSIVNLSVPTLTVSESIVSIGIPAIGNLHCNHFDS